VDIRHKMKEQQERKAEIARRISELRASRDQFTQKIADSGRQYHSGAISLAEYKSLLASMLKGRTPEQIIESYNGQIFEAQLKHEEADREHELFEKLTWHKPVTPLTPKTGPSFNLTAGIMFIVLLAIITASVFIMDDSGSKTTGMAIASSGNAASGAPTLPSPPQLPAEEALPRIGPSRQGYFIIGKPPK